MNSDIGELWSRLRRHRSWRFVTGYLAGGMAATLAVAELYEFVGLPENTPRLMLVGVVAGFPFVLLLAWTTGRRLPAEGSAAPVSGPPTVSGDEDDQRRSILVTPLVNQSPDSENEFIADGVTEEIITDLSGLESLRVIARSSAMTLKAGGEPMLAAARKLDVDYMLEGSVRRVEDRLRVVVRLVEVDSSTAIWSERFDGSFEEIFTIQTAVARSVADHLELQVTPAELRGLEQHVLADPRAYESYMRARYETLRFSEEGLRNAERHLRNGLAIVGGNPLLYSTLGQAFTWYAQVGRDPEGAYLERARECVDRVFELEPESPRGYWLQGLVRFHAGELRAALSPLERALTSMPEDPDLLLMLGYLTAIRGQHARALELLEHAVSIDPLTPLANAMPGFVAVLEGRFEDAVPFYARYRDMDPDSPFSAWCWYWALVWNRRTEEATEHLLEQAERHPESIFMKLGLAMVPALQGDAQGTLARLDQEIRQAARSNELLSRELTHCLALAGELDEALDWLANTVRIGNVNHPFWSRHDWQVDKLRGDPRFEELMAQVEREWQALNPHLVE